jgi:hypothetical protein
MHSTVKLLATAIVVTGPVTAHAQTANVGLDGLVGIAADDSSATGPDDSTTFAGLPSISFGDGLVVQVDGLLADHRDDTVIGGALRVGARIRQGTYVGAYGSFSDVNRHGGLQIFRLGGEARFDLGKASIEGVAGYEDTDSGSFLTGTTATQNIFGVYDGGGRFFAFSDVRFRPSQKVRLSAGHRYTGGNHAGAAGAAIGFGSNFAVIAEGRLGEGDYKAAFIGVRMRFGGTGGDSSLLDSRMIEDLFTIGNTRRTRGVNLPPPPDEDNGCGTCGGYCNE